MSAQILILEDQPDGIALLTAAVRACFDSPEIFLATDLAQLHRLISDKNSADTFDYALIDLRLPDGLSLEWLGNFKTINHHTCAIVTSLYDDDELVFRAMRAGADGYVLKGDGVDRMTHELRKVMRGEPPISPAIARKLMGFFRQSPAKISETRLEHDALTNRDCSDQAKLSKDHLDRLTVREQEVLALIGTGLMIKQVAGELGIGYHTVNDNIKSIYRKLGIRTRIQAAVEASKLGLIGKC